MLENGSNTQETAYIPRSMHFLGIYIAYTYAVQQDYWYQTSQNSEPEDTPVRFLTTPDTFCIVALSKPGNGQLVVSERLPVLPGDEIFLLGPHNGSSLPWSFNDDATQLTINVSESDLDAVDYAWAFQVRYSGNGL